ncbi:hypothetical protein WH50_08935 [Pokkaliibacter plantistimulans]|uniref:Ribonuclease Z n=2 Tax=Pseudomonadota TaxID=1224 RepID=A0ABX5LY73_9GAMM|nr:MBL fold metallo-hydrolase [Pokkaliibacter plantistimulans]PPC75812.1 MBL fold metallo-hydrolase [Pokkaliibacter plantistimulans]PXF31624.1 hypothetical protein WH50_08935 [Pokkaliibacter plantistimulans]
MELLFLGTSSGTPTKARNVSALALRRAGSKSWCLIDCGEGTQHQILHTPLSLAQLDTLLITHVHGDHCYGLPGLLASAALSGRKQPLRIIAPAAIRSLIDCYQQLTELRLTYAIDFIAVEELVGTNGAQQIITPEFAIDAFPLSHRVPSYAYRFSERQLEGKLDIDKLRAEDIPPGPMWHQLLKGAVLNFNGRQLNGHDYLLAPRQPRAVVIAGDNDEPSCLSEAVAGASLLVHEATFTVDIHHKVGPAAGHSDAARVARFAAGQQLPHLVLSHFSARYGYGSRSPCIADIEQEARQYYAGSLWLANDFDLLHLDKQLQLSVSSLRPSS